MKVKAKFKCASVTDFGTNKSVKMQAIYGKEGENADYSKATPYGNLEIGVDKDTPAADFFQPQKEYYLTFEKCDEPQAS